MTLDSHVACFNKVLDLVVTVWPAISNNIVVGPHVCGARRAAVAAAASLLRVQRRALND
jgi:hypothetical protein